MNDITLTGLAKHLVIAELLTDRNAQQAVTQAQRSKTPLVHYLVQNRLAKSREIAEVAADQFGVPLLDLNSVDREGLPKNLVSEKLIRQHHALPLWRRGNKLFIGLSDPTNHQATTDIQFSTGLTAEELKSEETLDGFPDGQARPSLTDGLPELGG